MLRAEAKILKPRGWKLLWIAVLLTAIASGVVGYFLLHLLLEEVVSGVALTFLCVGIAYYVRVRPSINVNRAIYVLFGITPVGFSLWILYAFSGVGHFLTTLLGPWPSLIIAFTVPYIMGAFIGDLIGRQRNYRLPLSLET